MSSQSQKKSWVEEILPPHVIEKVESLAKRRKWTEKQKMKVLEELARRYSKAMFEPGEAIGIITAQSISEPATQMTMRTYHFAGSAGIQVTLGLPRMIEIFDAKKEPDTPMMTIYLKDKYNTKSHAKKLAEWIKEKDFSNYVKSIKLDLVNYEVKIYYNENVTDEVAHKMEDVLKKNFKEFGIKRYKNYILLTIPKDYDYKKVYKLKSKILSLHVTGIKGIKNVVVRKIGEDWVINTLGSNLGEVLKLKEVDIKRTRTNNIYEVWKVLGIEAARNVIIQEAMQTLQQQGLNVDIRHIVLVADTMTFSGRVRAVGRYGVAGAKQSVLARAAFEETIKHLTNAAIKGEVDEFKGMFENVMVGQVVPAGTGMVELIARFGDEE